MELAGILLLLGIVLRIIKRLVIPLLFGIIILYVIGYLQAMNAIEIHFTGNGVFDYLNQLPSQVYTALKDVIQPLIDSLIQFIHLVKKEILRWSY
ncbi:hypothetical protein NHG25_08590 [Aerococcaceae bacterium NML191292]|nr:hypothetical protein [Aerococcaceae bacterium NML191292]